MGAWPEADVPTLRRVLGPERFMGIWRVPRRFCEDETAQDAVEYALLIGFVVVASAAGIDLLIEAISALWNALDAQLSNPG